jgi:diguanylate cyclase (GGDEF)-like protein/PAS domain S-box-containing protein
VEGPGPANHVGVASMRTGLTTTPAAGVTFTPSIPGDPSAGREEPAGRTSQAASRLWVAYLLVGTVVAGLYFALPQYHLALWTPLGLSSVAATAVGIRRYRPRKPSAWWLLAAAEFCFIAGDTTYNVLTQLLHEDDPFPSLADVFYLLTYPLFAAAILLMIRSRTSSRDRAALIDAIIITTGLGLLSWVYLIIPNFQAAGLSGAQRVISVAYPLGDVLVLAMLARLVGGGGARVRSMQLLTIGAVGLMVADVLYGLIQLNGGWAVGGPVDVGWSLFYLAWGCAALHPSMPRMTERLPRQAPKMGRARVSMLASVSLIAPAVLFAESLSGHGAHVKTVAMFSAALFLLVIARLLGILTVHQQAVRRERILRSTSESLVTAHSLAEIYRVALDGAVALFGDRTIVRAGIYRQDNSAARCVAETAAPPDLTADPWRDVEVGAILSEDGRSSIAPLRNEVASLAVLVVNTDQPMALEHHRALTMLATQIGLAVESTQLAADLRQRQSEARFRVILQHTSDVIVIVDERGRISYGTPSLGRHLGRTREEFLGQSLLGLLAPEDAEQARLLFAGFATGSPHSTGLSDWRLHRRDGTVMAFEVLSNNLLDDPSVSGIVLTMRDVSERRELESQLKHQAFHDALTSLPNRALFQDRAEHALARTSRLGTFVAMVMLDLDDFKIINDTLGHGAGDELLCELGRRLQTTLRADATVSRFGGDEFAILIEDLTDPAHAPQFADRALASLSEPFLVQGEELNVRASVGLVVGGNRNGPLDMAELMRCADLALYAAKERGKGQVVQYHADLHTRMVDRLTRRADLERALAADEFLLHFQPVVAIETGEVVGCEALVRWQHPTRGLVPPLEFIELAEETGLVVELGQWVLQRACAELHDWVSAGHDGLRLSVNVSARQLREPEFVRSVTSTLSACQVDPAQLVLELTESLFALDAPEIADQIQALRKVGIKIAMDDFGTGYSSLSYLQKFQLDILKVDKSFVDGLERGNSDGSALVSAIVTLAHSLRLEVVAEGIEQSTQRDELWSMGCTLGQGYLYSRPLPAAAMTELLGERRQLGPRTSAGQRDVTKLRLPTLLPSSLAETGT